jgi:hypothetical protein
MNKFYTLNIQNSNVTLLDITKNSDIFIINQYLDLDIPELRVYLKNKKNFYVSVEQDDVVDEKVSISSLIKSDNVIRNSILIKLSEIVTSKKLLFNYHKLPQKTKNDTTSYQVDGVYEAEYLKSLYLIDDLSQIKSATTNKFALFYLSQECIKQKSYFSINTRGNKITAIAVHEDEIVYSRTNFIVASNAELRLMNMVEEINQTVNYVKQQFREINFTLIALSGSIAVDDMIAEHLSVSVGKLGITVLYPNTFLKGLENEEPQKAIVALGSFFVPKKFQFLPPSILGIKQYKILSTAILALSVAVLFVSSFFTYQQFESYANSFSKYERIKDTLINTVHKIDTYSQEELSKSLNYLQIAEKHLQYHPVDIIWEVMPLIELQKPRSFEWSYLNDVLELQMTFKKSFDTLESLYNFQKTFAKEFQDINTTFQTNNAERTDYTKLDFETTLTISSGQQEVPQVQQRMRR